MTSDTRPAEPVADSPPEEDGGPRRLRALVILLLLTGLLAWAAAGAVTLLSVRTDLTDARHLAQAGAAALTDADPATARADLGAAEAAFARAERRLKGPAVLPLRALPVARPNVRGATALAAAGAQAAGAGEEVAGALTDLPGGVGALLPRGGTLPVDALQLLAPALASAEERLADAQRITATIPDRPLLAPLAEAHAEFVPLLDHAAEGVATAHTLVEILPTFLGTDAPKRYFLGAANPAELRGTGGLIGAYSILTVDEGRFDIAGFGPVQDLETRPPEDIPAPNPDYAARYDRYGGAGFWLNINMTPDFPSAAVAIETLYADVTGDALDGVVVVTPQVLAGLVGLTGPAAVPGGGVVDADEVVAFVANEAYGQLPDPEQRKRLLGAVAASVLDGFLGGEAAADDPLEAVRVLGDAAGAGHVLVHAVDERVQAAFEDTGVAGALHQGEGDYLAAVVNNAAVNKIDFYAERTVQYTVELDGEGGGRAQAAVELANNAPVEGPPAYVIGPNTEDLTAGENRSLLSVYCAPGCRRSGFRRSLHDGTLREETELGHPVFTTMVPLPSGTSERIELDWTLRDVWVGEADGGRYRLTVQQQPTIRPTRMILDVRVPEGTVVTTASDGLGVDGDLVRWDGTLEGTQVFEVTFGGGRLR